MKRAQPPLELERARDVLLTTQDVARLLRVHPKHVYRLLKRGLPARRVGGEWRFLAHDVLAWSGTAPLDARDHALAHGASSPGAGERPPLLAVNGDVAVECLLARIAAQHGPLLGSVAADRGSGLERLRRGEVLATGCHGPDMPAVLDGERLAFVHLVERRVGLVTRARVKLRGLRDLRGRRLASRPESAGVRAHFDHELRRQGIDSHAAHAHALLLTSHCDVASAVARGDADVGVTTEAWAARVGLGFRLLCEETYGLLVPAALLGEARVIRLCEVAQSADYRREVERFAGYDARRAGSIRHEPPH